MKITNTLNIIALLLSLLLFVGCEKDVSDEQLRVSPEIIEIGCVGGTQQVDIGSTSGWKVVVPSNCTWVKSDRYEGEGGHRQWIKLTISKNNTESTRKATVTISNRGQSRDIAITQSALSFDVTPESIDVGKDKTTKDININSNISWYAKTSDSWISLSKSSGNAGSSKITVTIAKNTTGDTRTGHIEIYNNDQNVSKKVVIAQNVNNTTSSTYTETVKGLNLNMIFVEGGTFAMGSTGGSSDESPVHNVTLYSYHITETEITQAQWRAIMGTNPSDYTGDNRPVENVSWNEAQMFCVKLSELTGKRYVLPTEAQWEYAARGGNKSNGYTYSGSNTIRDIAVYYDNSGSGHSNVKSKMPNELGIYDMTGNVWEWCSDWYGDYSWSSQTNPQGPTSGSYRVVRGGSWIDHSSYCRVADRNNYNPSFRGNYCGFRVVCIP